jgi:hypothetical protein
MEEVRRLVAPCETFQIPAATAFPSGSFPQAPIADEDLYPAGYVPTGPSLERIFRDTPDEPFRDRIWPKSLREKAGRVFDP